MIPSSKLSAGNATRIWDEQASLSNKTINHYIIPSIPAPQYLLAALDLKTKFS
jgi:hypothetical protein